MALFRQFRGNRASLDAQPLTDGYAYFCIDDGTFHIDYADENGVLHRKQINAKDAETLCGISLDELKNEIAAQDVAVLAEAQAYADAAAANSADAVKYTEQTLTDEQKAQARANIGVSSIPDASSADFDGAALVVKNGEWVISDIPVADKSDIMGCTNRMDHLDDRISTLEESVSEVPNMINEVADKKGQELDESHNERVRKAIGNVACTDLTKNNLAFFSPENIAVDYASSVPGWRVDFADGVIEKTNEYFAGANSTNDRKEIIFTPSADMIDIGFQTTSAHENSCTISNIDIIRVDGGSMATTTTPPRSAFEVEAVVVDESSFTDNMNGWTFVDNSNSWYGAKLLNASSGGENAGSVCMKTKGWGGIIEKTISVTPGVTYNVDFSMRVEANGINFKIADGSDQNGAALVSRYLTNMENTLYQYTITPTGSAITIRFSGSGASSSDVAYLYDIGVYECVQLGMSNWHLIEVNSESGTRLDAANQMLKLRSPWNNYWGNYASVPVINPNLDTVYLVRFKANINSGVTNLTGRNISFVSHKGTSITIGNSGEHIVSFTANATDDCYLVFSGGGIGRDDVEIYDFNIFANTASLDALDSTQSRWVIGPTCSYDHSNPEAIGATLVGNGSVGYIYNLRTLALPVEAGVQYKLTFNIDYHKPKSIDWSPYITFTNEDKTAFVTGYCANSESLQLGGPWVGRVISGDHLLKVSVDADSERAFEAQYLGIAYTMMGIDSVKVTVKAYKDGMSIGRITTEETLAMPESCVSGIWSIDLDSLQSNLLFAQNGDADKIEIIFEPMINDVAVQTVQYIDSISMHGKSCANDKTYTNDYGIDALKNVYFQNILFAAKFEGNIDDGDLDEGGLA